MCRVAVAIHLAASGSAQLARGATEPAVFGDTHRAHAQTQFVRNIIFAAVGSLSLANKRFGVSQRCRVRSRGGLRKLCCAEMESMLIAVVHFMYVAGVLFGYRLASDVQGFV